MTETTTRPPAATSPLAGLLLDERSGVSVRRVIGLLLTRATHADFAIARIRLGAVDLSADELRRVRHCRVLVGRLDVQSLTASPDSTPAALPGLLDFLRSGRIEVRSAATAGWTADFSVFRGLPAGTLLPHGQACLVGAHAFWHADLSAGPAFTCVIGSRAATACAARRFDELWRAGYDVLPVLLHTIRTAIAT